MEPCGIIAINKPAGFTSLDVVNVVRRLFGTRAVGHAGTLDPMATGVLVMLIGRAAKAAEYVQHDEKTYEATLRLGIETDTEDITGKVLSTCEKLPSKDEVTAVCREFCGETYQIPPMFSALKVGGRKLVDLAREGKTVERQPRKITVFSLECEKISASDYKLKVRCSGGTYIRTLCADIGKKLGCGGVMAALVRTDACGFSLSDCKTLDKLKNMNENERLSLLLPVENLFSDLKKVTLEPFYEKLFRSGCEIYQRKIGTNCQIGETVTVYNSQGVFVALAKISEFPDGTAVKSIKFFDLNT